MRVWRPSMSVEEREAVEEILSLPAGRWEIVDGYATPAEFFACMDFARIDNQWTRNRRSLNEHVKATKGGRREAAPVQRVAVKRGAGGEAGLFGEVVAPPTKRRRSGRPKVQPL